MNNENGQFSGTTPASKSFGLGASGDEVRVYQADLHATIADVQWVIEAYSLFLGGLLLVGGSLGDQFGRKRVFLIGVALFTLASVACGLAPSIRGLIAARAIQGVGAALLVPGSLAIISATFDGADRGRAIGTWSGFSAITSGAGPVAGGWLIEHVSWRAAFLLNLPVAAIVIPLSVRFMRESRDDSRTSAIDWAGAVLCVVGLGAVVFGLIDWPRADTNRTLVSATLAVGFASLIAFVAVERGVAAPMLPLALFRSRTFTVANVLTLLLYGALAMVFWLVPMNLIEVQHYSPTGAGAALLPFPLLMFVLSRWSGGLVAKVGSRVPLTAGPIVAAIGLALFARPGVDGSYWTTFFPAVAVLGLGMAIVVAPLTTTVMNAVQAEHAGVASGVNNAVSRVAGLVAIAVFGIVLVRTFEARINPMLDHMHLAVASRSAVDRELPKLAGANLASADVVGTVEPDRRTTIRGAVDGSFVSAFRHVMLTAAAVALAAAVLGALL